MKQTRAAEKLYWDSRAGNYPVPSDPSTAAKARRVLRLLARMGADFRGGRVLDIGCGTGVYALLLAPEARRVDGVDSSAAMLRVFRRERRRAGIRNASCLLSAWSALPRRRVAGRYDAALACMTAAVKTERDLLKMEAAAPLRACVAWAGVRSNPLMERIYRLHGLRYRAPEGAARLLKLLKALGRRPRVRYISESWTKRAPAREALREMEASMLVNGARFDAEGAKRLLPPFTRGGEVRQRTSARKALIVWRDPSSA